MEPGAGAGARAAGVVGSGATDEVSGRSVVGSAF
jgi:hypothetical protein